MDWFAYGIEPLLIYLEKRLSGIPIASLPVLGPVEESDTAPLPPLTEKCKLMAYCDDLKPAICTIEEFVITDLAATLFENSAGTKLHRDPKSDKCKFLPLGKWRNKLKQEDIPSKYMRVTDTLDMVGVQLCSSWAQSHRKNGNILCEKVAKVCNSWKAGKFMPLSSRPFSVNCFAFSKVWFRCSSVNLRERDIKAISCSAKKWIYADQILNPEENMLYRSSKEGGLGLVNVKHKAKASLLWNYQQLVLFSTKIK